MGSLKDRDIHEVTVDQLFTAWQAGNKNDVIDNLARRHAAIAVTFIVQGAQDRLTKADANEVANLLMDHFLAIRDQHGIAATERKAQLLEVDAS
jgi:ribosomal protein S7